MKAIKRIFAIAIVAVLAISPAAAQVRFGVKAGVAINTLHFNEDAYKSNNRAGFTGGVMAEFQVPVVGLCFDASLLYAHRNAELKSNETVTYKRDYIDIPVNLKYKFGIVGVENVFDPFVFTGPDFAILMSDKDQSYAKNKTFNTSWNVGFGAEIFNHLQIAATYGLGLSKALDTIGLTSSGETVNGKDHCWTITAAYLF
jgi:opacity protein-like surface antigen